MLNKLLDEIVVSIVGKPAEGIVPLLNTSKYVNEFIIAKKLGITINQTRNILYKISDYGLVSSIRKKDKKKGWYTYFWHFEILKCLEFLKEWLIKNKGEIQSQINLRNSKVFYECKSCGLEYDEDEALLMNFTCDECGEVFTVKDNLKLVKEMEKGVSKIDEKLKTVEEEIKKEQSKLNRKKSLQLKKEEKEKEKKRVEAKKKREQKRKERKAEKEKEKKKAKKLSSKKKSLKKELSNKKSSRKKTPKGKSSEKKKVSKKKSSPKKKKSVKKKSIKKKSSKKKVTKKKMSRKKK